MPTYWQAWRTVDLAQPINTQSSIAAA